MSGVLIQEKVHSFSIGFKDADPESFKACTGWLTQFNTRYGIKNVQLQGEILCLQLSLFVRS